MRRVRCTDICLLHLFWTVSWGHTSLDCTAVLCRTSKLMLMQLALLPSSQLHSEFTRSKRRLCVCVRAWVCVRGEKKRFRGEKEADLRI